MCTQMMMKDATKEEFCTHAEFHGEISSIGGPGLPEIETIPNIEFLENKRFDDQM